MIFLQSSGLEKMAHITLYFAANIQNNLNLARYNIYYSAECVTFCAYAAGFNSCGNKKHTRKIRVCFLVVFLPLECLVWVGLLSCILFIRKKIDSII
jgi:hypothetical protein